MVESKENYKFDLGVKGLKKPWPEFQGRRNTSFSPHTANRNHSINYVNIA